MNINDMLMPSETIYPSQGERLSAEKMAKLVMNLSPGDGFTIAPDGTPAAPKGYALAQPNTVSYAVDHQSVTQWYTSQTLPDNAYIGGWHDPKTGTREVNVSYVLAVLQRAEELCRKLGEDAIFDLANGENIYVS